MQCANYDNCPFEDVPDSESYSEFELKVLDWFDYEAIKYLEEDIERKEKLREKQREKWKHGISKSKKDLERLRSSGRFFENQSKIRAVRKEMGISADELAAMVGRSRQTICEWEAGRTKVSESCWKKLSQIMPPIAKHAERMIRENQKNGGQAGDTYAPCKEYGKRLKLERFKAGLTRKALADVLGVSQYTLRDWEGGVRIPNRTNVGKIEGVFPHMKGVI